MVDLSLINILTNVFSRATSSNTLTSDWPTVHYAGVYFCTPNYNSDIELFITDAETSPAAWDSRSAS